MPGFIVRSPRRYFFSLFCTGAARQGLFMHGPPTGLATYALHAVLRRRQGQEMPPSEPYSGRPMKYRLPLAVAIAATLGIHSEAALNALTDDVRAFIGSK